MSAALVVGIAAGGALGAAARMAVDGAVSGRWPSEFPKATLLINVTGSLLLGVLTGLALTVGTADAWRSVLGTGFCGGFTTFSTASFAGARLAQQGHTALAAFNVLGTLALCTLAAVLGIALAAA